MPEILAFISPDADLEMREHLALLLIMRGIAMTDDIKRATIVVAPGDAPKPEETLRKEIEQKEYIFRRLEHITDIWPEIIISKPSPKKEQKKSFVHSTTFKKYNCAKTTYAQRFFNRTTCK